MSEGLTGGHDYCSNCGTRIISDTKEVKKVAINGAMVTFIKVPIFKCECDEYSSLLDGVKMDIYLKKEGIINHSIRFSEINISDQDVTAFLRATE